MLKGVPRILSPELLKVLAEMGHGDEIVIADGNFPLQMIPLDQYVEKPAALMEVVAGDPCVPVIWDDFRRLLEKNGEDPSAIEMMERFSFYERAKKAYAIVSTGETAIYANILLKKGVVA